MHLESINVCLRDLTKCLFIVSSTYTSSNEAILRCCSFYFIAMGDQFFTIVSSYTLSLTIVPLFLGVTNPGFFLIFIYHSRRCATFPDTSGILSKYLSVSKNGSAFHSRKVQKDTENIIFNISPRLRSHFFMHKVFIAS